MDTELSTGRRVILPAGQDLPILCFRFEERGGKLVFVHTDKFGVDLTRFEISDSKERELKAEYGLETTSPMGLPHRVRRLLTIPENATTQHGEVNIFKRLLSLQGESECSVPYAFTGAEQISVRFED
jgi:hypothetical protein